METHELLCQYADGVRDFSFTELTQADLAGADLGGADLHRSNLSEASLTQANLSGANLRQANLTGANLSNANLRQANLSRADLKGATLHGADLAGATFTNAILPDGMPYLAPRHSAIAASRSTAAFEKPLSLTIRREGPHISRPPRAKIGDAPYSLWTMMLFWCVGFSLFGSLLSLFNASVGHWLVAWLSSLCWWVDPLTWFIPIIAAIAVMDAAGTSVFILAMAGLIVLTLTVTLTLALGRSFTETLKVSLLIGGLGAIVMQIGTWLFYGADAYRGGGIALSFETAHLGLLLIFAVGFTSLGAIAWQHMGVEGVSKPKTAAVAAALSALGLLCGRIISLGA